MRRILRVRAPARIVAEPFGGSMVARRSGSVIVLGRTLPSSSSPWAASRQRGERTGRVDDRKFTAFIPRLRPRVWRPGKDHEKGNGPDDRPLCARRFPHRHNRISRKSQVTTSESSVVGWLLSFLVSGRQLRFRTPSLPLIASAISATLSPHRSARWRSRSRSMVRNIPSKSNTCNILSRDFLKIINKKDANL